MRVLLDENIPHKLRGLLKGHETVTVAFQGWVGFKNGELLRAAEDAGFDVLITSDKGIPYEQKMTGRKLALVMLSTPDWNVLKIATEKIAKAIDSSTPGSFTSVDCGVFSRRRPKLPEPAP